MEHYRIITVKTLPASNTRGTRVKITEDRGGIKDSVTISYNYKFDNSKDLAIDYLTKLGINIIGSGIQGDDYILLSDSWGTNFKAIK